MRVHYLQHVPFEGIGSMAPYLADQGHRLCSTQLYSGAAPPLLDALDWLIIMGGPMGVGDEGRYPWLAGEKAFIREAVASGKILLGICLGAQLIADVLGAAVYRNRCREIGWFPIEATAEAESTLLRGLLPPTLDVFHWHGDTFDIPANGVRLASSAACRNQGFIVGERIVGLQFHLETTRESARALVENCRDELDGTAFVQDEAEILSAAFRFQRINTVMSTLLDRLQTLSV
jgi:GMP synthase (glutamine-hydrolysing)